MGRSWGILGLPGPITEGEPMLTPAMRSKLEDLVLEFTNQELQDLTMFLKMAREVQCLPDGTLAGLAEVLMDKGNPNMWNLMKLVEHELRKRTRERDRARMGKMMAAGPGDLPAWKDIFPKSEWGQTGTMVPPGEDPDSRQSELARRGTRPQPGDE